MASLVDQQNEFVQKRQLIRIGLGIGVIILTFMLMEIFETHVIKGIQGTEIPFWNLGFWGAWIIVFILLERYLIPRDTVSLLSQEIKRQNRLYLAVILILGIVDFGLSEFILQKWNSGAGDEVLPLMLINLVLILLSLVIVIRYFIFIMDNKEKNKKTAAEIPSPLPLQPVSVEARPEILPDRLTFFGTVTGLLKYPKPMMAKLQENSFLSAFGYFLAMLVALLVLLFITCIPFLHNHPPEYFIRNTLNMYVIMAGAWIYTGLITHILVRIQGVQTTFSQTLRTFFYSSTPLGVIGWIPFLGFFSFFWGLYHIKCGLVERQDVPSNYVNTAFFLTTGSLFVLALFFIIIAAFLEGKPLS